MKQFGVALLCHVHVRTGCIRSHHLDKDRAAFLQCGKQFLHFKIDGLARAIHHSITILVKFQEKYHSGFLLDLQTLQLCEVVLS